MNREVLINIINRGGIRFIPVRRCFLCNEYVGYKFVRMCDGSMIPVFSSGCRCCGINNGTLSERTWDEVLDLVKYDFSYEFKYKDPIYEHPTDYHRDIFPENLCGKLLFRYINNNIMPHITKGKYYSTGKYIDGKYNYKCRRSRVILGYEDNCPLTGMCYDYYLLKPIIDYYDTWCTYPENFSLEDLIEKCYNNFFKAWHEEYEHWADDEDAIREELHHNQYEDQLYYENGDVYVGQLNEIA